MKKRNFDSTMTTELDIVNEQPIANLAEIQPYKGNEALNALQNIWVGNCNPLDRVTFEQRIKCTVKEAYIGIKDCETEAFFHICAIMKLISFYLNEGKSSDQIFSGLKSGLNLLEHAFVAKSNDDLEESNVKSVLSLLNIKNRLYATTVTKKKKRYGICHEINRRSYPFLVVVVAHATSQLYYPSTLEDLAEITSQHLRESFCMDSASLSGGFSLYYFLSLQKSKINNYGIAPTMLLKQLTDMAIG